jgi:hypothetical protein
MQTPSRPRNSHKKSASPPAGWLELDRLKLDPPAPSLELDPPPPLELDPPPAEPLDEPPA